MLVWELATFGERPYDHMTDSDVIRCVFVERSADLAKPNLDFAFIERLYVERIKFQPRQLLHLYARCISCRAQLSACCCQSVELRPSMRELRIALLDLLASTSATGAALTSHDFDSKWEQLMRDNPRQWWTRAVTAIRCRDSYSLLTMTSRQTKCHSPAEQLETAEQQRDTPNDAREAADEDELHINHSHGNHNQQSARSIRASPTTSSFWTALAIKSREARSCAQQLESFVSPIVTTDSRNANKSVVVDSVC